MRHAICVPNFGSFADPRTMIEFARAAEAAGWDGLFVWDHLAFVWGPPAGDSVVLLAAAAASTERIVLGTAVTPLARHRPHLIAHAFATLDALAPGRIVLGAGLGGEPAEFSAFGDPVEKHVRATMLDDGLELVSRLWTGHEVRRSGAYAVSGVSMSPVPEVRPPIWIGGNSPAAHRRAARWDGWIPDAVEGSGEIRMTTAPAELGRDVAHIRSLRESDTPFDVAVVGYAEVQDPRSYEDAGATWWLEAIHDMRGPLAELRRLVDAGPP